MKIYVLGNLLVEFDSLPIRLLPQLRREFKDIDFIELDPSEDIVPEGKEMLMIDTALDAKEVGVIEDIDRIELGRISSLHDFDLGYNLKLMKKFGMIDKIKIICLPPGISEDDAIRGIRKILSVRE